MQLCKIATKTLIPNEACCFQEICLRVLSFCKSNFRKDGVCVHSPIIKLGLHYDMYLSNNLLNLYAKCFGVEQARHFFDEMPQRDVVSWTSILSANVKSGHHHEALEIFGMMLYSGQCPNEFTLSSALRSCSAVGESEYGAQIHAFMVKLGLEQNPYVNTTLIDMYTSCDYSVEAYKLLSSMDDGDAISWTTMISSLAESEKWSEVIHLYIQMIEASVYPNEFTFVKLLGASCFISFNYGKLLHAHTFIFGIEMNVILKTALVNMYSKFRHMEDAIKVTKLTPEHDVFLWTTIISGFAKSLRVREALNAFLDMGTCGILPNNFTFASLLNACSSILSLDLGTQFHSRVIMAGLEDDVYVGNALVDMYSKCSSITTNVKKAFREISSPNVISWTSLIAGFVEQGFEEDAFHLYIEMREAGVKPNSVTLSCILRACSNNIKSIGQTRKFHAHIIKTNADDDIIVGNALVDTYSGQGMIAEAWSVIGSMNRRDPITYTSLVARINQRQNHALALNFITHMCHDNIKIDEFSLASFLSAAASLGSMETGKQLHCYSVKSGLESCISVSNSLVHLYSKCGNMNDAYRAFVKIDKPDVISWNAMISGLASNGHISDALSAFDDMKLAGVEPDSVTFSSLLFACSHGGLFDLGLEYFQAMEKIYHITPNLDNYVCLVDLLGRADRLEEAVGVIETMPFKADSIIYKTLLNASKLYGNVPLGEDMARRCLELDPSDPAIYLLLATLYDNAGFTDLGDKTRQLMRDRGLRKSSSQCWMEIRGKIYHFSAGESSIPQMDDIDERLKLLETEFRNRGYPYIESHDKFHHPERLAVAFGLLSGPTVAPIRINKNLHICSDCHNFIMLVTQVVNREIIVRDGNKIHLFQKGHCSCRNQW